MQRKRKLKRRELKFKTGMYCSFPTEVKRSLANMYNHKMGDGSFNLDRVSIEDYREQLKCVIVFYRDEIVAWTNWLMNDLYYPCNLFFSIYVKVKFRGRGIGTFLVRYTDRLVKREWEKDANPDFFKHALKKKGRNNGR